MTQSQKTLAVIVGSVVLVVGGLILLTRSATGKPGQYDALARCLTSKGAKLYGAYWCPHCQEQKKILGDAMKYVDFVECGVEGNQQAQAEACKTAGVNTYPTWVFADGTRLTGLQQPDKLAETSGCPKPEPAE